MTPSPDVTLGVDVGQAQDPTAIVAVVSRRWKPEGAGTEVRRITVHNVIRIARLPLKTPYPEVVQKVDTIANDFVQKKRRPLIVVDATGVGRPVVDMFRSETRHAIRAVTFTGGTDVHQKGSDAWSVPKWVLMTALKVVSQTRRLHCAPGLELAPALEKEIRDFNRRMTRLGELSGEAQSGRHDDLVCALALAVWWNEKSLGNQSTAFMEAWGVLRERAKQENSQVLASTEARLDPGPEDGEGSLRHLTRRSICATDGHRVGPSPGSPPGAHPSEEVTHGS